MKKIKILRIIARLNIGGPAIHTILLAEGLDKAKFDSLLACGNVSEDEGDMFYYACEKNVKPYLVPGLKRELSFLNDIRAFKKIYKLIQCEQPDIIHTHTAKAGALGRTAGILFNLLHPAKRVRLMHTYHGHIFSGYFNKLNTLLFVIIERLLAKYTCAIVTVSESVKKELVSLRIAKEGKIKVIPLGLELEKFLIIPPRNSNILHIGIIGRLVPIKNHRLFLKVAAKVITDNPQIELRFRIIGDGQLKSELKEYSQRLNIGAYVDFLGWQRDLPAVYSDLDIIALTSINEGTPVSLIEAMAAGRPVVATDVGGVRDLLGNEKTIGVKQNADFKVLERGILVEPQNSDSFAAALNFILENNALRRELWLCARDFIKTGFTKERLIKDIERLYGIIL